MTPQSGSQARSPLSYVIISGGTGANPIAAAFGPSPAFVLPVSDDGGSSSEILRCFGGPSIGDIRSRLIRLIPFPRDLPTGAEKERMAIYNLMAYRFPVDVAEKVVRDIWMDIVEGRSELWEGIGEDKKECIRAFLVHFQTLCLRRAHKRFSFRNFSLGNGFLTGARDLFGSLPSAIFLFKSIAGLNQGVQVIPVINTNQTITIAAQLANASTLVGQCAISHPTPPPTTISPSTPLISPIPDRAPQIPIPPRPQSHLRHGVRRDSRTFDTSMPPSERTSLEEVRPVEVSNEEAGIVGNLGYQKGEGELPLEARIERVFYINLYGQEIFPEPNPEFLDTLAKRDVLVYSCGSLWTSIIPCLALRGLATAIASSPSLQAKVMLLNAINDRETPGYTAADYVTSLLSALRHYDKPTRSRTDGAIPKAVWESRGLITHIAYLEGGRVEMDEGAIEEMGVKAIRVPRTVHGRPEGETPLFTNEAVEWAMARVME